MEFSLLGSGEDGGYNGTGFVEISKIFLIQDIIFLRMEPFDPVYTIHSTEYY